MQSVLYHFKQVSEMQYGTGDSMK